MEAISSHINRKTIIYQISAGKNKKDNNLIKRIKCWILYKKKVVMCEGCH